MSVYTRAQYMADHSAVFTANPGVKTPFKELRPLTAALHRRYFAQFVSARTIAQVVSAIGANVLRASTDFENLNDIPLARWDRVVPVKAYGYEKAGDYATLSNDVCVSKEAAKQWIDSQRLPAQSTNS